MQGERELDGSEVRSEVAGVLRHRFDDQIADLAGEGVEFGIRQVTQVGRLVDSLEKHLRARYRCVASHPVHVVWPSCVSVMSVAVVSIAEYGSRLKNWSAWRDSDR